MQILDLFAGIGGFSLAAHWMGWSTAAFVEKEPFCQKVLRKNFGQDIEIYDDIFNFSGKPFQGRIDIITGGFPCQPFSAAGKRKGRADERHLFPQMLRVISEVKPRWVVAENVRGLLSIESGSVFAEVVASLEGEGYEVITFCVPASAVEAPHRRDRLWIVAGNTNIEHRQEAVSGFRRRPRSECSPSVVDATDSNHERCIGRGEQGSDRKWAVQTGRRNGRSFSESAISGSDASDTSGTRPQRDKSELNASGHAGLCCGTGSDEAPLKYDPNASRVQSRRQEQRSIGQRDRANGWSEHWIEVASRLCGMDDGLSPELDITGARDNRVSRLKALGNAVVPIIPFEIFKAIEAAGQDKEN